MTQPKTPEPNARRHTLRVWVHYRMTDKMGVVYYANYLELFEMARSAMIREQGFRYAQMEADGFMLPVVRAEVDYLAPAYFEDQLVIETWVDRLTKTRIDFNYEIRRNGDPGVICRGHTRHIVVGPTGAPRRLSESWIEHLRKLGG